MGFPVLSRCHIYIDSAPSSLNFRCCMYKAFQQNVFQLYIMQLCNHNGWKFGGSYKTRLIWHRLYCHISRYFIYDINIHNVCLSWVFRQKNNKNIKYSLLCIPCSLVYGIIFSGINDNIVAKPSRGLPKSRAELDRCLFSNGSYLGNRPLPKSVPLLDDKWQHTTLLIDYICDVNS